MILARIGRRLLAAREGGAVPVASAAAADDPGPGAPADDRAPSAEEFQEYHLSKRSVGLRSGWKSLEPDNSVRAGTHPSPGRSR